MKRMVIMATLATLLAATWPAWAQPGPGPGGRRGMDRGDMPQRPTGPPPERGWQRRDGEGMQHRRGMMTPEEREKLRRDIGQHGRDIYRDPRRDQPGPR